MTRFKIYCKANNNTVEQQKVIDRLAFPGKMLCGFVLWVSTYWDEWHEETKTPRYQSHTMEDHQRFDAWLLGKVG